MDLERATAAWCLMKRETEDQALAFVRNIECLRSLDKMDKAVRLVCLQRATASSVEKWHSVEGKGENESAVSADGWFIAILF